MYGRYSREVVVIVLGLCYYAGGIGTRKEQNIGWWVEETKEASVSCKCPMLGFNNQLMSTRLFISNQCIEMEDQDTVCEGYTHYR